MRKREATCPRCWLDPLELSDGEPVPIEFGPPDKPEGVDCPECGLVYYDDSDELISAKRKEHEAILACFREEQQRGTRGGGGHNNASKRKLPPIPRTENLLWLGYPERDKITTGVIDAYERPIFVTVTQELDRWLQGACVVYSAHQRDVIRLCLEWARRHKPDLSGYKLESKSRQRRRITVALRAGEQRIVQELAGERRLGQYVALVLELLRRRPSLSEGLDEINNERNA